MLNGKSSDARIERPALRRLTSLVCLFLFLSLQFFAFSNLLHHAVHADAAARDHQCAVTLLNSGSIDLPSIAPVVVGYAAGLIFLLPLAAFRPIASLDVRLSPGRAPPLFN